MTRLLLADDDKSIRAGMRILLVSESDLEVIGEAIDGYDAIRLAKDLQPDVVLMDVVMPKLNGIEATRQIVATHPRTRVIAVSMHDDPQFRKAMFKAGASAFLLKDNIGDELTREIRIVSDDPMSPVID